MARIMGLDHVSLLVADAEKARAFYQDLFGLARLERPDLGFPGYWLDLGGGQSLHLMQLPNPYANITRPAHGGRDGHFALRVNNLGYFIDKLKENDISYRLSQSGRQALFFQDLDKNWIELVEG